MREIKDSGCSDAQPFGRCALVIAHPGHELRLFGWLDENRPDVFVLTDGSGHAGASRIESTRRVLKCTGAAPGGLFGRYTDQRIYEGLLRADNALFVDMAETLTEMLLLGRYRTVVTDPLDGYNPTHDLCSVLAHAAARALRNVGRTVRTYEYPLTRVLDIGGRGAVQTLRLTPDMVRRKRVAVGEYTELSGEAQAVVRGEGERVYAEEVLRETDAGALGVTAASAAWPFHLPPDYETYGERQAAAGRYIEVIRYREHFAPVLEAIRDWACARPLLRRQTERRRIAQ
jgi:hypothetical protein